MRFAVLILLSSLACAEGAARPADVPWQRSPDGETEVSVRHIPTVDGYGMESEAKLLVRNVNGGKITQTIHLETAGDDERNRASVNWSPNGHYLAVNVQTGQLRGFGVYHLVSGRLKKLAETPMDKKFVPEHRKSRGGPHFQQWLGKGRLEVFDNSSETEFVYLITKENRLQVVAAKLTNP